MTVHKPTAPITVTAAAKKLGGLGGLKGGPARAAVLTRGRRQEIARQGGRARARKRLQRSPRKG